MTTPTPGPPAGSSDHYSYTVYADPSMAEGFDTLRFSGPIGTFVAEEQAKVLADFSGAVAGRTVLDVGTGTGRAAIELARRGASVTGVDASDEMLRVGRERAAAAGVAVTFKTGDAHALPFDAATFDLAVSLRVLMHTPDWRVCVGELCRVAREQVIFDFPAASSAAAVQAIWRRGAAAIGRPTEAYRVFRERTMARELERHGFRIVRRHRQFVLPIAVHKAVGSRTFTRRIEAALSRVGLLRLFGSPVTILAERCASS